MHFSLYALPAIIALFAKAAIFLYARRSKIHNLQTRLYLLFLFSLSIQNLAEIAAFAAHADGLASPPSGRLYFSASILAIAFLLHLALILARSERTTNGNISALGMCLLYVPAVALQALLWGTSLLVSGFETMGYTYTKIAGPLYFLFQLYAIGYLCFTVAALVYGALTQVTAFRRSQNKLMLVGLLPWVVLIILIIILQQFGFRGFNSTVTLPLAITFFLFISAYATHQHRVFDIELFIPWSKVRKRKTAFYERIQALIAEMASMTSVHKVVKSLSEVLHCPVVFIGGPKPALAMAGEALGVARFPIDQLRKIDHIAVANEIAEAMPDTYKLMKRHRVAAIVPFHAYSQAAASWMLLGEKFSENVYSPLDFKVVEALFARLADHFLDNQLLLRAQLAEAKREMEALHHRLANAWGQLETLRKELRTVTTENRLLKQKNTELLRGSMGDASSGELGQRASDPKSLDEHVAEFEARLIATILEQCNDDIVRAAEVLEIPLVTLYRKICDYRLSEQKQRK